MIFQKTIGRIALDVCLTSRLKATLSQSIEDEMRKRRRSIKAAFPRGLYIFADGEWRDPWRAKAAGAASEEIGCP